MSDAITLYDYHGRRVRAVLLEKGLEWTTRLVDLTRMEQKRPEYLALNPNGVVPTGLPLGESRHPRVCDWLARLTARPAFVGSETVQPG